MPIRRKFILTASAAIFALAHILLEYFNGGVVTHHLLADANYPGFSNWWGLLSIPVLTWLVLSVIGRRRGPAKREVNKSYSIAEPKVYFFGGLAFGLLATVLWKLGQEEVLQYVILLPLVLSPLLKVYLPETGLGFVMGMLYAFGGVLPILFTAVIQTAGFLIYTIFNRGGKWLLRKFAK